MGVILSGRTTGFDGVMDTVKGFLDKNSEAQRNVNAFTAAEYAERMAVEEMVNTPSGRMHRGNRRPSAPPGAYPAPQTTDLIRSMKVYVVRDGVAHWDAGGGDVPQAFYMEFGRPGSYGGPHVPARPYMRPTLSRYREGIKARLRGDV